MQVVVEDRCVLKKWPALRIVIGRYGYKSSFGANNKEGTQFVDASGLTAQLM